MANNMENLLAQTIIEATKVNQTDIALERMTNNAVRANLHAQQNLVSFQQGRMNNLERDLDSLKFDLKNKNLEKKQLQDKLKIAINMYEEANDNTGSWIELLNKPLHVIAKQHTGFNDTFQALLGNFSKIVLDNMVKEETIDLMAETLEYSPLEVDIIKNQFEQRLLESIASKETKTPNEEIINTFHEELTDKNNTDKKNLKKQMLKSGKNYKW